MAHHRFIRLALLPLLCGIAFPAQAQMAAAKAAPAQHVKAARPPKPVLMQMAGLEPLAARQDQTALIVGAKPSAAAMARTGFEPAPLPNPDVDAPGGAGPEPRLSPALLSRKAEFLGNGFSNASSLDYGAAEKRQPAAGVNLLVPGIQ